MASDDEPYLFIEEAPAVEKPSRAPPKSSLPPAPGEEVDPGVFDALLERRPLLLALWPDRDATALLAAPPDDAAITRRVAAVRKVIEGIARRSSAAREQAQVALRFLDESVADHARSPQGAARAALDALSEAQAGQLVKFLGTLAGDAGAVERAQLQEAAERLGLDRERALHVAQRAGHAVVERPSAARLLTLRNAAGEPVVLSSVEPLRTTALVASVWDDLKRAYRAGELHAWLALTRDEVPPAPPAASREEDAELNELLWSLGHTGLVIEWGAEDLGVITPEDLVRAYQTHWQRLEAQLAQGYVLRWVERFYPHAALGATTLGAFAARLREQVGRLPAGYLALKLALACGLRYLPLDPCQPGDTVAFRGFGGVSGRPAGPGAWDVLSDHVRHGTALVWVAHQAATPAPVAAALVAEAARPGEARNVFREHRTLAEGLAATVGAPEPSMLLRVQLAAMAPPPTPPPTASKVAPDGLPGVGVAREEPVQDDPSGVPGVTNLVGHDFGAYLQLTWQWPEEVSVAVVAWRSDAPPVASEDGAATRRVITRGEYERAGGFRLERPDAVPYHLAVYALHERRCGPAARIQLRRPVVVVRYELTRGTFRRGRFTLTLRADAAVGSLPELVVVARPGDLQPLRIQDGREVFVVPSGLSLSPQRPFALEFTLPAEAALPVSLRVFFRAPAAYAVFQLADPAPDRLKVR